MTHLILDGADLGIWSSHHSGGLLIPPDKRPSVLQADRECAELECLRLAQLHPGVFVLFAPVAMAKRLSEVSHVNLRGEAVRLRNVARLLPILDPLTDSEIPF